jgi:small subunit ribosomal protein S18
MPRESQAKNENEKGSESQRRSERRYYSRPKVCQFCTDKHLTIDYKKADMLKRFITDEGKIRPRRQTGTCARHQRALAGAIKQARHIALLPYTGRYWEEGAS